MATNYKPFAAGRKALAGVLEDLLERVEAIDEKLDRVLDSHEGYRAGAGESWHNGYSETDE